MKKYIAEKNASVMANLKPHLSGGMLGKIKQNGEVRVSGVSCKMSHVVNIGDEIEVFLPVKVKSAVMPFFCDLEILYEDSDIVVVEKPAGMPTHTSRGNFSTTLENAFCGVLQGRGEDVSNFTFHPITRLDKETSGIVLIGKNPIATAKLSADMQCGEIKKEYLAVARGKITDDFSVKIKMDRTREGEPFRWQCENGKDSETHFKVVKHLQDFEGFEVATLLKATPITGRTHQIRVHLAFCGNAIVGDKLYQSGGFLQGDKPSCRLYLHMARLRFLNMKGEEVVVASHGE